MILTAEYFLTESYRHDEDWYRESQLPIEWAVEELRWGDNLSKVGWDHWYACPREASYSSMRACGLQIMCLLHARMSCQELHWKETSLRWRHDCGFDPVAQHAEQAGDQVRVCRMQGCLSSLRSGRPREVLSTQRPTTRQVCQGMWAILPELGGERTSLCACIEERARWGKKAHQSDYWPRPLLSVYLMPNKVHNFLIRVTHARRLRQIKEQSTGCGTKSAEGYPFSSHSRTIA